MSGGAKTAARLEVGELMDDSAAPVSIFRGVLGSILTGALIASLIMLGGCYRQNVLLQQRLTEAQQLPVEEQDRIIGRIQDQLASETLILREEIIRSKSDNKDMDAALAAAQQEARAAIARAAACEEAFQPLLAELGTLKVAAMMADDAAEIDNMPTNTGGVMAAQALQDAQYQGDSDDHGFVLDLGGYDDVEIGK